MNPFEMVLGIIIVLTIGGVLRARYGIVKDKHGNEYAVRSDGAAEAENRRLTAEIASMKERIAVLERVVTDNEGSLRLDREIEKLRDARRD